METNYAPNEFYQTSHSYHTNKCNKMVKVDPHEQPYVMFIIQYRRGVVKNASAAVFGGLEKKKENHYQSNYSYTCDSINFLVFFLQAF